MSAGAIFLQARRILTRHQLPELSQHHLMAVLEAGRPGPLAFLYEAGVEAGLPRAQVLTRGAAVYFSLCAVGLSDDLTDNECTYLPEPFRTGPCTELMLQTLSFQTLAEANLPPSAIAAIARDLVLCGGAQDIEMQTRRWSAPVFREVAEGIVGRLWSGYLQMLWTGTWLAKRAPVIGRNIGLSASVWDDIRSHDPRFTSLPEADKHQVLAWAMVAAQKLRKENLHCLGSLLSQMDPVLRRAA
jgi:hypothetical protein